MKRAMTLVELMVAVAVLSMGIVVILQSRLGVISALIAVDNQIAALKILEKKVNDLEFLTIKEAGIENRSVREDISIGKEQGTYQLTVRPVTINTEEYPLSEQPILLEASVQLAWQQERAQKKVGWSTLWPSKEGMK